MSAVAHLNDLGVAYRGNPVLQGVTGSFDSGSMTAIVGANGAGKSTLLKAMLGLVPLSSGSVRLNVARERIAYLAQQSGIERSFPLSVLDCATLGFWPASRLWRRVDAARVRAARQALDAVGLGHLADDPVGNLSAGQFQRMLFVRVQLQDADFILLDEPFNAVDARTTADLLAIIAGWHAQGRTVVAVLHDHLQVRESFGQTLLLAGAPVAWGPTEQVMSQDNLSRLGRLADRPFARAA